MDELQKTCRQLRAGNLDFALLSSPENVIYTTGFEVPLLPGFMGDVSGNVPLALVLINARNETARLIVSDFYRSRVKKQVTMAATAFFTSFNHFEFIAPLNNYVEAVQTALRDEGLAGKKARLGVEFQTLPSIVLKLFMEKFPKLVIADATAWVAQARKIKTDREIELLREAARVADIGQQTLLDIAVTNKPHTEFDIWFETQNRITTAAGPGTPFVGELVTGPRTGLSDYPLGPTSRAVEKGDLGLMDISPRIGGYWADCSNVVIFNAEPNPEQRYYFKAVQDAFEAALESLKPGKKCCEVEAAAQRCFEKNGFEAVSYLGHQIGAGLNELPRITCYDNTVIEPNMVFCLEPQQYSGKNGATGVRIERMVRVTATGVEVLNKFPWGIHC